jgi:hypothetical protein
MLALELFVVVVAVDARWLIRSLEYHYRELFSASDATVASEPAGSPQSDADAGPASPVDYLDKIFQIPYVLAPPPPAALASYLRSLLPPSASPATAQETQVTARVPEDGFSESTAGRDPLSDTADARDALSRDEVLSAPASLSSDVRRQSEDERAYGDRRGRPATSRMDEPGAAIPDLRPLGLQLSQPEVEFMTRLGPLLPTPRAAKRLVNLYRLVRIGIPDPDLAAFTGSATGGPYQVVQILLAVLVGSPAAAQRIFRELLDASADSDVLTVFAKAASADHAEGPLCARIGAVLARIASEIPVLVATAEYQRWCPRLARYSFHTRTMTAKPPSLDAPPAPGRNGQRGPRTQPPLNHEHPQTTVPDRTPPDPDKTSP